MENKREQLKNIKMLVMDVDGVMTDCRIWYDGAEWRRFFSIRDGVGIKRLGEEGYKLAVITGSRSQDIRMRVQSLGIHYFYEGALDKVPSFDALVKESGFQPFEMAYIGDDIFDIPLLKRVGFAVTVADSVEEVVPEVDVVTKARGGEGAVRELSDILLKYGYYSQGAKS